MKMNIVTISTKINRGGAGKIAFTLHRKLSKGIFIYGYDKKGLSIKSNSKNICKGSNFFTPYLNFIIHKIYGKDFLGDYNNKLENEIKQADIIHLHIIHSYAFNYTQLFNLIIKHKKPLVITAHDSWYYTGRCAIIKDCQEWNNMCKVCSHLEYYPSSILNNAHNEFIKKTELIKKVQQIVFVSPSQWLLKDIKKVYPHINSQVIPNGIETNAFKNKFFTIDPKIIHLVFIVNDFEDKNKVDTNIIENLLTMKNIHLHLIGANCPFNSNNTTVYGYLQEENIINILFQSDILLFFSKIDNYPTVLIEGLCAGLHIVCTQSKGTSEIMSSFEHTIINSKKKFFELIDNLNFITKVKDKRLKALQRNKALEKFSQKKMLIEYSNLYKDLLKNEI